MLSLLLWLPLLSPTGRAEEPTQPVTPFRSPVSSACISSPFGPRVLAGRPKAGTFHPGIDMPAPAGEAVRAIAAGTVLRIQRKGAGGLEMMVQHDGFIGIYSHLGMIAPAFAEGKRSVAPGEKLAVIGRTGVTYGTHLFFEVLQAGQPVDPAPMLGLSRCHESVAAAPATAAEPRGALAR